MSTELDLDDVAGQSPKARKELEQLRQQRDELREALEEQVLANGQPTESELERARQALANAGKEE